MTRPPAGERALLLDIDGVLIPYGGASSEWGDWFTDPARTDIVVSRQAIAAIGALDAEVHWVTSWATAANSALCPVLGWTDRPILMKRAEGRWWKLEAVESLLASSTFTKVAWVDDDLDQHADEVDAALGALVDAGRLLLVCPVASAGISRDEIEQLRTYFSS